MTSRTRFFSLSTFGNCSFQPVLWDLGAIYCDTMEIWLTYWAISVDFQTCGQNKLLSMSVKLEPIHYPETVCIVLEIFDFCFWPFWTSDKHPLCSLYLQQPLFFITAPSFIEPGAMTYIFHQEKQSMKIVSLYTYYTNEQMVRNELQMSSCPLLIVKHHDHLFPFGILVCDQPDLHFLINLVFETS